MTDLTKILKVGDKLWDSRYGEVEVFLVNDTPYPITVSSKAGILSYTKDGRSTSLCEITLYPLDQKPAPPSWPDSPQTFEWEGEVYEKGEWVAVDYWNGFFFVRKLDEIDNTKACPIKCITGWMFQKMRKLSSFNTPDCE